MSISLESFVALLTNLASANNELRNEAEASFEVLKAQALGQVPFYLLSTFLHNTLPMHIRQLALVILRRVMKDDGLYASIESDKQAELRAGLLTALHSEDDMKLKFQISDIVKEVCGATSVDEWPELMAYLFDALQSQDVRRKEIGLGLLGTLPQGGMHLLFEGANFTAIMGILQSSLLDCSNDGRLMLQALRSLMCIFGSLTRKSDVDHFQPLLPSLFAGFELSITAYAELLVELAALAGAFFCSALGAIVDIFGKLLTNSKLRREVRLLALEFLVTLTDGCPKLVRKLKGPTGQKGYFLDCLLPICVDMLQSADDSSFGSWAAVDGNESEDSDEEEDDTADVVESAVQRICGNLGVVSTYSLMSTHIAILLRDRSAWKSNCVGLRLMGSFFEVTLAIQSENKLAAHEQEAVSVLVALAAHPDQRVRYYCFLAMSQFLMSHGGGLTEQQSNALITVILQAIHSSALVPPKLRREFILTLSSYVDYVETSELEKYTGEILEQIVAALSLGPLNVQESCIAAIISLSASVKGPQIGMYYDSVLPILKQLLSFAHTSGAELLYGQTLECCAMFGEASGREKFYNDAVAMMQSMVQLDSLLDKDSAARPYLMKAWVRIARCLGADFSAFLPFVMSNLLTAISQDVFLEDQEEEDLDTRSDVEFLETDAGWVAVRTSAVEEQSAALNTIDAIAPLLKSPHEDVRCIAVACLPELVQATAKSSCTHESLVALTSYAVGEVVLLLEREESFDIIVTAMQALTGCVGRSCTDWSNKGNTTRSDVNIKCLNSVQLDTVVGCVTLIMREALQRRAVLKAEGQVTSDVDDADEADESAQQEGNVELFFYLEEFLNTLMQTHGEDVLPPYCTHLSDTIVAMSHAYCLEEDRGFALTVMSDLVCFCAQTEGGAGKLYESILPVLINGVASNPNGDVKKACAEALGKAAERFPVLFSPVSVSAFLALGQCIAGSESKDSSDSAVAAVGDILISLERVGAGVSGVEYIWQQWLDCLPLRHDKDKSSRVTEQLLGLLAREHSVIADDRRIHQILAIFQQTVQGKLVADSVLPCIHEAFLRIKAQRGAALSTSRAAVETAALLDSSFVVSGW